MVSGRNEWNKLLSGGKNVRFSDLTRLAEAFGFRLKRIAGSHHIYVHPRVNRPLNLQSVRGQAKPYQVRQLIQLVEEFGLEFGTDE